MPINEDIETKDAPEESSYGQHLIHNPEKHSMALCARCGAKFFWDGAQYSPLGKDVNLECPKAE